MPAECRSLSLGARPVPPGANAPRIVCFGPGPRFKGGIAQYNTALARALYDAGARVTIASWSQPYPAFIPRDFADTRSRDRFLAGYDIPVLYLTNWNAPTSWWRTARTIAAGEPDKVVLQWCSPLQGLPMAVIASRLRATSRAEIVFDVHFVTAKERSWLDAPLTRLALEHGHTFVVHSYQTAEELRALLPQQSFLLSLDGTVRPERQPVRALAERVILKLYHPIYSLYRPDPSFDRQAWRARHGLRRHVFLFFGFIRKYKGLHYCLQAFAELVRERDDVSLLVVGEPFWRAQDGARLPHRLRSAFFGVLKKLFLNQADDERGYDPLARIDQLGIRDRVLVVDRFVANEEVAPYFQAADAVLLFYETASPSGVASLGFQFGLPALATRLGHLAETIVDGENGYLAEPGNVADMVRAMKRAIEEPIPPERVLAAAEQFSWANYARAILAPRPLAAV